MSYKIIATDLFDREVKQLSKKYRSLKSDLIRLGDQLKENPGLGTSLGNDCYKLRIAITSKGQGKSGGARIITHVFVAGTIVYMLAIYDKSAQNTISDKEILKRVKS